MGQMPADAPPTEAPPLDPLEVQVQGRDASNPVTVMAIPVVVIFRKRPKRQFAWDWGMGPLLARVVRDGFGGEYQDVLVVTGHPVAPYVVPDAAAALGVMSQGLPSEPSREESSMHLAEFLARHVDAQILHEELGRLLKEHGVKK